jgi:hypothetical protein
MKRNNSKKIARKTVTVQERQKNNNSRKGFRTGIKVGFS